MRHALPRDLSKIAKTAMRSTPEGKKRGLPQTTWRRTVEVKKAQHAAQLGHNIKPDAQTIRGGENLMLSSKTPMGVLGGNCSTDRQPRTCMDGWMDEPH